MEQKIEFAKGWVEAGRGIVCIGDEIAATGQSPCLGSSQAGVMLAKATAGGISYSLIKDGSTIALGQMPPLPVLDFGLQKAGAISFNEQFEVPAAMAPASLNAPLPNSRVHPAATNADREDCKAASTLIRKAWERTVAEQAHALGYFDRPFKLRYALRHIDGSYLSVSAPIWLIPSLLPPCIAVNALATDENKATIALSGAYHPFFQLRCRVAQGIPPQWRSLIGDIDIFITAPIPTYDEKAVSKGVTPYRQNAINPTGFDGIWSEADDCYRRHEIDSNPALDAWAWDLCPNHSLSDQLLKSNNYHLIASLPTENLVESQSFFTITLLSTDADRVKQGKKLGKTAETSCRLMPSLMLSKNDKAIYIADKIKLPAPHSLRASMAFIGNADAEIMQRASVEVWLKANGSIHRVSALCHPAPMVDLTNNFPVYLSYPDPRAFRMRITQAEKAWDLPLTPSDDGECAQWHSWDCPPCASANEELNSECLGDIADIAPATFTSQKRNPLLIESREECHAYPELPAELAPGQCAFTTRPIRAAAKAQYVELLGDLSCRQAQTILQGSASGLVWHNVACANSHAISNINSLAWRYYRLLVILQPGCRANAAYLGLCDR